MNAHHCDRLPKPWSCSLSLEHEGPCSATRDPLVPVKPTRVDCATYTDYERVYGFHKEQRDAIDRWVREHDAARHLPPGRTFRFAGAIGGAYTYEFTPTTIGVVTTVRCSCGDSLDVSDYDQW